MAKKPVKRRTKTKKAPLIWIKLITGEEVIGRLVSRGTKVAILDEPMSLVVFGDSTPILTPYALFSKTRRITYEFHAVVTALPVNDVMEAYYETSLYSCRHNVDQFDLIISKLTQSLIRHEQAEPEDVELDEIEKEESEDGRPSESKDNRSRTDVIDSLMRLAGAKGLTPKD